VNKWIIYQQERFPILPYTAIAITLSFSGICLSMALRGAAGLPHWQNILTASITSLLLFFQLRVADEFKDHDDDCRYQPYRPVPRGLITLRELGIAGAASALIQIALTLWLSVKLLPVLLTAWAYLGLMTAEFFMSDELRKRPLFYLLTHMLILLFLDTYVTGCDWIVNGAGMPPGLVLFLLVSFFNGIVIELGRKLRAPSDEETGVDTYTRVWGIKTAGIAWLSTVLTAGTIAWFTSEKAGLHQLAALAIGCLIVIASTATVKFVKHPTRTNAKIMEKLSGAWVMCSYLVLGTLPAVARSVMQCIR